MSQNKQNNYEIMCVHKSNNKVCKNTKTNQQIQQTEYQTQPIQ